MAQNMESLLMGGDDSSSGESDDEVNVSMGATAAPTVARTTTAPRPAPASAPSRGKPGANNQRMAQLKNLYTMSKQNPQPLQRPPAPQQRSQAPAPIQAPPQQQRMPSTMPSRPQQQQQRPMHQPQQQQQQQRSQLYQQSQQQKQQPLSRPSTQQRPQYAPQPTSTQRPQYAQQPAMSNRTSTQPRQSQYPQSSSQQRQQYAQQQQQQQRQSQSRGGTASQSQSIDPFAPTPLSQIKQSSQSRRSHPQQQQPQQQVQRPHSQQPQQVQRQQPSHQEIKRNKEKFLMFTRVLIKYLEAKDPRMHAQAKNIIKDCADRNKRQEPGYESVTLSMRRRLKELVGDHYWKKAHDYLVHFMEQKKRQAAQMAGRSSGSTSAAQQAKEQVKLRQQQQQQRQRQQQQEAQRRAAAQAKLQKEKQTKPRTSATSAKDAKADTKKTTAKKTTPSKDSKTTTAKKTTKKTVTRRKSDASASSRKSTTAKGSTTTTQTVIKKIIIEEQPREYKELMELIDHSVEYDWPSIGQLLGNKADLKLNDEELRLLYGDNPPESLIKKKTTKALAKPEEKADDDKDDDDQEEKEKEKPTDGIRPGWSQSNVLSARAAWARIRWKEVQDKKKEAATAAPVVADGLLTLPTVAPPAEEQKEEKEEKEQPEEKEAENIPAQTGTEAAAPTQAPKTDPTTPTATPSTPTEAETPATPKPPAIEGAWFNDETAEQDKALALLSEGCQIYLQGVLQKAIQCARQRQNLDGIRLWHQQYSFSKGISSITTTAKSVDKSKKPPLSLRLGCDVARQAAQAQGNAALTVKRMEEALDRQTGIPMRVRNLNEETMLEATSMGDLAWRPLLKKGAQAADLQAKRAFEVYGGKDSKDPPLGRVPKKAKLLVQDFVNGAELSLEGPYHKAYTASSFLSF